MFKEWIECKSILKSFHISTRTFLCYIIELQRRFTWNIVFLFIRYQIDIRLHWQSITWIKTRHNWISWRLWTFKLRVLLIPPVLLSLKILLWLALFYFFSLFYLATYSRFSMTFLARFSFTFLWSSWLIDLETLSCRQHILKLLIRFRLILLNTNIVFEKLTRPNIVSTRFKERHLRFSLRSFSACKLWFLPNQVSFFGLFFSCDLYWAHNISFHKYSRINR